MNSPSIAPRRPTAAVVLAGGLLVLFTLAAYHNSFRGPFLFDDNESIRDNPTIRHLWPLSTVLHPPYDTTTSDRPFLNLTYALNYAASGLHTWGYHAVNLLVHVLAGLALFGLVRRTLLRPVLRKRFGGVALPVAFCSALIWLLHPVQTQSVTYLVGRAESLMGLFYLLTLYCFARASDASSEALAKEDDLRTRGEPSYAPLCGASEGEKTGRRGRWIWGGLSWAACFFSMCTKEVAVTAPVMVLFYDRTFVSESFRESWRRHWGYYCALAATWLAFLPVIAAGGKRDPTSGFGIGIPFWGYVSTQFHAIAHYWRIAFWPRPLLHYYGLGGQIDFARLANPGAYVPYALLVLPVLGLTVVALWRWPVAGFIGAWFFGILAPTSLVPGASDVMADRRIYLPLAAILVPLVAIAIAKLGRRGLAAALVAAAALGLLTERRNRVYTSEVAFWSDQVAKHPRDFLAHYNLAGSLDRLGRLHEATLELVVALKIHPGYLDALNGLGVALAQQGRMADSVRILERALAVARARSTDAVHLAPIETNLGHVLLVAGHRSEAIVHLQAALKLQPDYGAAHALLAEALRTPDR